MNQLFESIGNFFSFIGNMFSTFIQGMQSWSRVYAFCVQFPYQGFLPWWLLLIVTMVTVVCIIKLLLSIIVKV